MRGDLMADVIASKQTVKPGNTLIFMCDERRDGNVVAFDGSVQSVSEDGVHVVYLSGYRSSNDFIPWKNIVAKVDKRKPYVKLKGVAYSGRFLVFSGYEIE